jgi:hypothetical protein
LERVKNAVVLEALRAKFRRHGSLGTLLMQVRAGLRAAGGGS